MRVKLCGVAALMFALVVSCSDSANTPTTTTAALIGTPPSTVPDPSFSVQITPAQLPSSGGVVTALISSTESAPQDVFGVAGQLNRWDRQQWLPERFVVAGWNAPEYAGSLYPYPLGSGPTFTVPAIGFHVYAAQTVTFYVRVTDLAPGWYQLCFGRGCGVFEVFD